MALAPFNIRQNPVSGKTYDDYEPLDIDLAAEGDVEPEIDFNKGYVKVENADGSVTINIGQLANQQKKQDDDFTANIAMDIDGSSLGQIANDLLRLIEQDEQSRAEYLQQIVMGLELLGTKIESPKSNSADGSTSVEGQATVKHPLLLEAIVRFQANAQGEMLPAAGPVKLRNDGLENKGVDIEAHALEMDFNHYLTATAVEYYPDTERMFFSLGFCGTAFKKVYHCPIRRRPVSEFVDVKDVIVSNAETNIDSAQRVTHHIKMQPSIMKRMQLMGVYRSVPLTDAGPTKKNAVDEKIDDLQGVKPNHTSNIENELRDVYECYCELDIPGYEHEDAEGNITGLRLPYRVTIDKSSREILEIRRWWKQDDENFLRKRVFVDYIFVPGIGFYGIGLLHLLGNSTMALTAGWRLCLDNGMFANFPGFLYAKQAGRQLTNEFRVAPGSGVALETGGQPIQNVTMPLPYRGVDGGFLQLLQLIDQSGQRLGGTAELNVSEGNTQAPVGTTIALIEQAQKVMSSVHKRMHAAQAREFELLRELFKEDPESFWRDNKYPVGTWNENVLIKALNNVNLVPTADPNTPSQTARIQKAMAIKQLQAASPGLYDPKAVDQRIMEMLGINDAQSLFAPPQQQDPMADPAMVMAQAKMVDSQAKMAEVKVRAVDVTADAQNRAADRESKERISMLQLAREIAVHPESANIAEKFIKPETENLSQNPNV
jgi:hypothetical protein